MAGATAASSDSGSGFSFHDLISIVNPLQHLPVIGTLYRAITGDTIGTAEKIAGDTLYGGMWGAVSSIADAAFEKITGKDFGDTVLAMFTGSGKPAPVAVAANTAPVPAMATPANLAMPAPDANIRALTAALASKGVNNDIAQRAVAAYQRSMALPGIALAAAQ